MTSGQRVWRNFSILLSGRVVNAVLNLGAISLLARALPLAEFGMVVLLHMYVLTVRGLFNLKPFLAIIKYGVGELERGDHAALGRLLALSRRIDLVTSALATVVAIGAAPLAGRVLGWSDYEVRCAMGFSLLLLVSGTGTATGVLRLFDRFRVIARQLWVGPALRCAGAAVAWGLDLGFTAFVVIWALSLAVEYAYLLFAGYREWGRQGMPADPGPAVDPGAAPVGWPGLARFLGIAWVQTLLDMVPNRLATLMVGASLGAAEAGLFRAARECAGALSKPTLLLRQVVFPDLARLWAVDRPAFRGLLLRVTVLTSLFGIALAAAAWFVGGPILALLFGPDFAGAGPLLSWLLLAAALELGGAAMRPAGYAMGLAGRVLAIHIAATLVFAAVFYPLLHAFGLSGLGMAASLMMGAMLIALMVGIERGIRHA